MNKEIMELIQPYMDKTETFGCIVKGGGNYYYKIDIDNYKNINSKGISTSAQAIGCMSGYTIGHYDITAVLKYIECKNQDMYFKGNSDGLNLLEDFPDNSDDDMMWIKSHGSIPNKPLSLYTEQEEKDLLELLNKLGTKN